MVKMPKRAGQSFDLAVTAVTIESMGVTPPCTWSMAWVIEHGLCGGHILSNQSHITVVSTVLFWYL